jgi:hypothetical protein
MSSISKWMLPPVASYVSGYNLRNNLKNCVLPRCRLQISENPLTSSTVRIWSILSPTVRNLRTTSQLRLIIKGYGEGSIKCNILHTRLMHQCSSLKTDQNKIHVLSENSLKIPKG